ncbi:APC family permease [Rhodopila sp.]|uniref:APC family permease n=1 Tax=Rhodopila sp. TaxID=2480087 RepID=UPI002D7EA308|nr:APC family permease [Rhodopila sp.]
MDLLKFLFGRRLANREHGERRIGVFEGIPAMGLDGLGSASYGPEAALSVMIPLGGASLAYISWVMAPIVGLLLVLFVSYWQTIKAYPNNGGAYIVARENLGISASLLAAAALMIDYVLNVAVGISAGVGALVSAVPSLHPYILPLCLGILVLITMVNLRGTLDMGRLFALPTYTFVASFIAILAIGAGRTVLSDGHPQPIVAPPVLPGATEAVGLWLLLRAFASGCTAMTGVEAVSNGMSAFREPTVRHGHRTLAGIVTILGTLLIGIAYLATAFRIGAMDQTQTGYRSVLSQLAAAIVGNGTFYYIAMASALAVLALSANTSFVDFPRMCRMVAEDGFLPKPFAIAGRRLVLSVGILYLAVAASALLVLFGGITDSLIPLFAIGAFLTFTLSQAGMVIHWRRQAREAPPGHKRRRHCLHLSISLIGAITTGSALGVIAVAKFVEGAWITILVIPMVIVLLRTVRRYYDRLAATLDGPAVLALTAVAPPIVLVAIEHWNQLSAKAVEFALTLSSDVIAVHLTRLSGPETKEEDRNLHAQWRDHVEKPAMAAGLQPPRLMVTQARYRTIHEPFLRLASDLERTFGQRKIAVLIPEIVKPHWYQYLLHAHRARNLRSRLLRYGGSRLIVISTPWRLEEIGRAKEQNSQETGAVGSSR